MQSNGTGIEYFSTNQCTIDWQTWLKHQVDFNRKRRIAVTGSPIPIPSENPGSGVGRWHTIKLPTLSFYEYVQIRNAKLPPLPKVNSLMQPMEWSATERARVGAMENH